MHFSRGINQALEGLLDIGCKLYLNLGDKNFTVEICNERNFGLGVSHREPVSLHSYPDFSFVPDLGGISGVGSNRSHELSVAMGHLPPSAQGKIREINHQVLVSFSTAFEKELHENIVKFWTRTLSFIQILTGPLSCQALRDTE